MWHSDGRGRCLGDALLERIQQLEHRHFFFEGSFELASLQVSIDEFLELLLPIIAVVGPGNRLRRLARVLSPRAAG